MPLMSNLTEWLLACIAEDEAVARAAQEQSENTGSRRWYVDGPAEKSRKFWVYATGEKFAHVQIADHIARNDPAHVLAVCKAHREIIDEAWLATDSDYDILWAAKTLALAYADRPGYRKEWKP